MSIIYSLIARGQDTVLVEYSNAAGNFPQITRTILKKIKPNAKLSYSYNNNYFFHYINEDAFTYLCMTEPSFSKRVAFSYLQELKTKFMEKYPDDFRKTAIAFSMNSSFSDIIKEKMTFYNTNPDHDKLNKLKSNLNEVKDVMVENIDKILEREQKVEILVKKTTTMNQLATSIKKQAVQVRRDAYWKNIKVKIFLSVFIMILVYIFIAMLCGGLTLPSCV